MIRASLLVRSLPFLTIALVAACSSAQDQAPGGENGQATPAAGEPAPAPRCTTPAALPAGEWFTDVTAEVGLADVEAIRVSSADLDGDGLPDLVLHGMASKRDTAEAPSKRVFLNKAAGTHFEEITGPSGLLDSRDGPGTGRLSHFSVFADVDNDGDLDLFDGAYIDTNTDPLAAKNDRGEIYINDGKGNFTMAPRSGPSKLALPMSGASFADYDRDGLIDLFVGTFYQGNEGAGNRLFKGAGDGSFVDVSTSSKVLRKAAGSDQAAFLRGENRKPAYGVTACDVDDDGDVDLIVSAYGRSFNELWRNDNGVFTEIGYGTPFAADDDVDFKSDNEFYHCWCSQNANQCTPEDAKPKVGCDRFSWTPGFDDQPARNAGNTFTTACADLDNDGDLDFIHATIKHWHIGQSADPSQIIRNDLVDGKPTFTRIANDENSLARKHSIPDWNDGDMDVGAFDVDNDGRKDIWLSSSDYPDTWGSLFHQKDDGTFENATVASNIHHYHAHGFAAVDIDGDGDLDLVVATSLARCGDDKNCPAKGTVKVYRNNIGSSRNWLKVRLHGKGEGFSNAAGIGAKVTVVAGGKKQVQEVGGGYGHFGLQHDTALTFGTGATCGVETIEVRWPNQESTVQRFTNVPTGYAIDLYEGEAAPKYVVK